MEVIKSIFVFFIIFSLTSCHLLPEDSVTDDAEQLNREKRDNFLDSILKSIPFFNVRPSENVQQENDAGSDDDEEDDMEADKMLFAILPSTRLATYSTALAAAPTSLMSSVNSVAKETDGATSHIHNAPTLFYTTVSTLSLSNTPQLTSASPYISIIPSPYVSESLFTIDQMNMTIFPTKTVAMTDKLQSSVMAAKLELTSAMTYASASSIAGMPASSNNIKPSNVETMTISPSADLVTEPVIKMMIMSAENPMGMQEFGPRLPNERGYGDTLAKISSTGEASEIKNIRFLYSNVLLPVMSGIFGALLITVGILIFKCLKKRKLKVRYYGGKPNSALYRLDQMSLLSDSSSEEE